MADAANIAQVRVVEPHVARGDAQRGRVLLEHDGLQAVQGEAGVAPELAAHQVLQEVTVVAVVGGGAGGLGAVGDVAAFVVQI